MFWSDGSVFKFGELSMVITWKLFVTSIRSKDVIDKELSSLFFSIFSYMI